MKPSSPAYIHILQDRTGEALDEISELCLRFREVYGTVHPIVLRCRRHQTTLLQRRRLYEQSLIVDEFFVSVYGRVNGPGDTNTLRSVERFAYSHAAHGTSEEAIISLRFAIKGYDALDDLVQATRCRISLGVLLKQAIQPEATAIMMRADADFSDLAVPNKLLMLDAMLLLILCYLNSGEIKAAKTWYCRMTTSLIWALKKSVVPIAWVFRILGEVIKSFSNSGEVELLGSIQE